MIYNIGNPVLTINSIIKAEVCNLLGQRLRILVGE